MHSVLGDPAAPAVERSGSQSGRLVDGVSFAIALVVALLLILGWLGGDWLVGDEHNAVYFLKDGLWDYIKTFHYGHLLKIQFWAVHALFGNSFFWYRMPAALASVGFVAWLACVQTNGLPGDKLGRALVILFVVCNMQFLYFARWGMPNYAESILIAALLLSAVLPETIEGQTPRWTALRIALIALLPWVYPATVILLGGMSVYFGLYAICVMVASRNSDVVNWARRLFSAAIPLIVGVVSFLAYRWTVPDAQWERARGHHASLKDWIAGGHGGAGSFISDSLKRIGGELLTLPGHGGGKLAAWSSTAYVVLGLILSAATIFALTQVVVRALRAEQGLSVVERRFLRGALFLATVLFASIAVSVGGSLLDVFPTIGMRHLFFLVPVLALLFVLTTDFLGGRLASRGTDMAGARTAGRVGVAAFVMLAGVLIGLAVSQQRRVDNARMQQLMNLFHSPQNDITFSYAPGFFISKATVPGQAQYFQTDAGTQIPGAVIQALRNQAGNSNGGRIAILMRSSALESGGSQLGELIKDYGLQLIESVTAGNFTVLALRIPHAVVEPDVRTVDLTVPLPSTSIVSVRLDPTQFQQSTLSVGLMELKDAAGAHPIDPCGDRRLTLVRSLRIGNGSNCSFVLGDSTNAGWFAPSALRNLPASTEPRLLHVRMTGEFSGEIKIYVDQGSGFSNPIRKKVADSLVAP